ncbi:Hint domain-containing protein [Paracoccus alcaliphilus]|uniref:Hint domain-containing protein n=1 Tax=Paracoccus alcaliphilus TaxID=34002 RepID=A0A1H8HPE7_9RHOB|nr:Hint domain-containing protein [Paracoccus alcaliphilus]SEN58081.1 Hint domain-containing protein [Paracoccus alcaliphilus]
MAEYTISFFTADAFQGGTLPPQWENVTANGTGQQWNEDWVTKTFTLDYDADGLSTITVNDTDAEDDTLNDYEGETTGQAVTASTDSALVGANVENEYEFSFEDAEGNVFRLVALSDGTYIFGYTFDGAWPPSGTELTVIPGQDISTTDDQSLNSADMRAPCFTRGTMIATPHGEVAIEDLREGDLVLTKDHGPQPVRWIGSTNVNAMQMALNEKIRPIRIKAGALGDNSPASDLVVSPQHRVLVRSKIAQRMFGTSEILVAARQLLQLDGIDIAGDLAGVEYFHMLFDRHEVVVSNGAETESLFTGPQALKALGRAAQEEIFTIFPELRDAGAVIEAARPMVSGRKGRKLALRHAQAGRALVA